MLRVIAPALIAQATCTVAAAAAAGRHPLRALGGGAFALGALLSPLLLPTEPRLLRFLLAVSGMGVAFRALDLARDETDHSFAKRLWLFVAVLDIRRLVPSQRQLDGQAWAKTLGYIGLGFVGYLLAFRGADAVGGLGAWPLRWLGGAVLIYAIADAANHGATALYALGGHQIPPQHNAPIRALSVGDFWSKHYNLNVSNWLSRNFYKPLARRGRPFEGLFLSFLVSCLFHLWICWVCLPLSMALLMGAFFLVQGGLIAIERISGQRRWSTLSRHVWTVSGMLLASPLFVEPFLRILR